MSVIDRREFVQGAGQRAAGLALAGGAAVTLAVPTAPSRAVAVDRAAGANGVVVLGVIGCGGMGGNHVRALAARKDVELAYACDADASRAAAAAKAIEGAGKKPPKIVADLRRVLDDKSVDAVFIATPDHWHAPAAILACNAGKHVYVEKPCSHNIREGRLMIEAARRNKRVVQVGTQSRSMTYLQDAVQALREGAIGDVLVAKAWNSQRRGNIGHARPSEPPASLDYDLWTGPAPMTPYQSNLLHSNWRWWYDFGAGDMGNDGVHDLDIARWGLGVESHPSTVAAIGGKYFFDDDQQFPDTQYVVFDYPADAKLGHGKAGQKRQLIFEQRIWSPYFQEGYENGNAFYGTKGMMILGKKGGWKIIAAGNKPGPTKSGEVTLPEHHQNFLDCIASGKLPHADIEIGHLSSSLCHLGNIASRVGRILHFDPQAERIAGDEQAGALVRRTYRENHWAIPAGV